MFCLNHKLTKYKYELLQKKFLRGDRRSLTIKEDLMAEEQKESHEKEEGPQASGEMSLGNQFKTLFWIAFILTVGSVLLEAAGVISCEEMCTPPAATETR